MRFLATADWQLGMTAHYLDDDARPRFQQARLDAVRRIAELAEERGAAFVVVCGDVFESNQLNRAIVARAFEAMREFTVPLVLVPGNHDPLDAASIYDSELFRERRPEQVHVLRGSEIFEVVPGVELVGAPWFSKRPLLDLVAAAIAPLHPVPAGVVRIVAGHGAVSTLNPDRDLVAAIDVPNLVAQLDARLADVVVLGDRHSSTEVEGRIWYSGAPEVTSRREEAPGNVLVIDVDPRGADAPEIAVETVRVGRWVFATLEERLDSADDVAAFLARLDALPGKERTALWLALSGTLSTSAAASLEDGIERAAEVFARIDHWQRHSDLVVLPEELDFADLRLGGFAQDALTELTDEAHPDPDAARGALSLLFRLTGGGR